MKKVFVLTIIAILALGVFALAENYNEIATVGPTCTEATLTVHSVIGIEQGYVATATSYNASFCGATGNPLTYQTSNDDTYKVLLANLTIESNSAPISVTVDESDDLNGAMKFYMSENGGSYSPASFRSPIELALPTSFNGAKQGTINIATDKVDAWTAAGKYTVTFKFYIAPVNTY